jgi:hypothetical protein
MFFNKGPVITTALAEELIAGLDYYLVPSTTLMNCTLRLKNGYAVTGHSACLPTTEFDIKVGMEWARKDAVSKLMDLLAFQANDMITNGAAHAAIFKTLDALKENENE